MQSVRSGSCLSRQPVGVPVPQQQHRLKKQHADGPDHCRSAEPGQNRLRDHGLNLKQQECAEEDRQARNRAVGSGGRRDCQRATRTTTE